MAACAPADDAQVRRRSNRPSHGLLPEKYCEAVKDVHSLIQATYRRQELPYRARQKARPGAKCPWGRGQQARWLDNRIGRGGSVSQKMKWRVGYIDASHRVGIA